MELNITCRFMSVEERKLQDGVLYALNLFVDGKPITLYLAEKNPCLMDFMGMTFGETVTIKVAFVEHPKVANAYKMKFRGIV